jgi:hypothetical protein
MAGAVSPAAATGGTELRVAVWLAFALLVVIMFGSAFIRFAHGDAALEAAVDVARWTYRVAAGIAVFAIAAIAVFGWDELRPAAAGRVALATETGLAVALTLLGRFTPSEHPLVAFGNPLGGLALVGIAWWLVLAGSPGPGRRSTRPLVGVALIAVAFAAIAALVVWAPGVVAGLAMQFAATAVLVAGVTLLYRRSD